MSANDPRNSDAQPPRDPTLFRVVRRSDLRVVRFNRRILILAGALAGVILLAVITVLPSHHRGEGDDRGSAPLGALSPDPEPWFERMDRALPIYGRDEQAVEPAAPSTSFLRELPAVLQLEDEWTRRKREIFEKAVSSLPIAQGASQARTLAQAPSGAEKVASGEYMHAIRGLISATEGQSRGSSLEALSGLSEMGNLNQQRAKKEFLEAARSEPSKGVLQQLLVRPESAYIVSEGSVIPCVLEGGINSDLPGPIRARVRENVYDTPTGRFLLIPQGTLLTGVYDSVISYGQSRVLLVGKRLIFPDASSIRLEGMPLLDTEGYAGLKDKLNRHYVRTFGSAILLAAISGGVQISQGGNESRVDSQSEDIRETLSAALGQQLGQVSSEMIQRNLRVQPTIEIRPGTRFNLHVMQDLVLPGPYQSRYFATPEIRASRGWKHR